MTKLMIAAILAWCCVSAAYAQSERSLLRDGNRQYSRNRFTDAEVNYRKAMEKDKDVRQGPFNLGDALYKQDRFGEAAEQYNIAASKLNNPDLKAQALHNLGNALLKEQKIPESIAAYKEALKLNPKDEDTKYNYEYARMLLQQQQQKQQQKQNQQQQQDQKQKQDQKQNEQQKQEQQQQQQQMKQQQEQAQQKKQQQMSKQDAERILEALKNEEKDVQKKLQKKVPARVRVEKDW